MRFHPLIAVLVLIAALSSVGVAAEPAVYYLTGHYQLRIGDAVVPDARLFMAKGQPRLLIMTEALDAPYLLVASERKVRALTPAAVTPVAGDADAMQVDESATAGAANSVKPSGKTLLFTIGAKKLVVEPPAPLVAELSAAEARARIPEFRRLADAYQPNQGNVRLLSTVKQPVELLVFLGSWCPHCERLVPRLAKTLGEIDGDTISARYRFLPRKLTEDPVARQYGVTGVPTVIMLRDGAETSRFEGADLKQPDASLARILFGS